jgi:cytochrome c556
MVDMHRFFLATAFWRSSNMAEYQTAAGVGVLLARLPTGSLEISDDCRGEACPSSRAETHHMIRTILAVVAVAVGVTAVVAQTDPIAVRKGLMKKNNQHAKAMNSMAKGEAPFDAAAANAAFAQWSETAQQLPTLFPDNSKTGGDTRALPKIWENRKDFDAKIAAFAKAVESGKGKAKSLDGLKAAMPAVNKACTDCHEGYRAAAKKKK